MIKTHNRVYLFVLGLLNVLIMGLVSMIRLLIVNVMLPIMEHFVNFFYCPGDPECNNRGKCIMGFTAPSCVCNTNYTGDNCSTLVCPGYPNNICNKRGYCSDANGSPQCFCTTGYDGDGCQNETNYNTTIGSDTNANDTNDETTTMEAPCPGPMCNGHGNCSQGLGACENCWSGLSCGERDCPKVNGLQCSNRGICIGNDTYSYCNCTIAGWIEDDCGTVNTSYCPNNCSGQTCNTHDVPFCECGHGLEGVDCGIRNSSSIQSGPSDLATWQLVLIIAGAAVVGLIVLTLILVFAIPTLRFAVFPKLKN